MKGGVFSWVINRTAVRQVYPDRFSHSPVIVEPNCLVDARILEFHAGLEPIDKLVKEAHRQGTDSFYLQRTFAIGDTLMLVPVIRHLRTLGYKAKIRTTNAFAPMLQHLGVGTSIASMPREESLGIVLDYLVERDHIYKHLQHMHRVRIYFEAIGLKLPDYLDWTMELDRLEGMDAGLGKDYIVFQPKGSGKKKSLTDNTAVQILKELAIRGSKIALIGEQLQSSESLPDVVETFDRRLSLPHLFSLIAGARLVICMDSSPLWISHFTKTPVVCVMGPTRPSERLSQHPLYPEGAVAVRMNEKMDCESCFEMAVECKGKIDCLNAWKPQEVWEALDPAVTRFL